MSMLQDTLARLSFLKKEDIYIATNTEYLPAVRKQIGKKIPIENVIVEPSLRDTTACIGLAAVYIAKKYPDEIMAIVYADHLIKNKKEFIQKLKVAEKLARSENTLNIIAVKAKYPNTKLGYIKIGRMLKHPGEAEIATFEKFIEKPNYKTAVRFLNSYKYLWNTGLYVWKVSTILQKLKKYTPNTWQNLMKIQKAIGTKNQQEAMQKYYPRCDKISIDYGIMEHLEPKEVRVIPAELGWSDVGTWESILEELVKGDKKNFVKGNHIGIDTRGSLIYGNNKKIIATIGIKDLIIVEANDALLICDKKHSHYVKKIVEKLQKTSFKNLL